MLRVLRRGDDELVRDRAVQRRLTAANDARRALGLVRLRGVQLLRALSPDRLGGIFVDDFEPPEATVVVENVDRVPVGELGNEQRRQLSERRLVVERRGEPLAGLGEDGESRTDGLGFCARTLPLGDVRDDDADADRLGRRSDRVVADERVANLAPPAGQLAVHVLVEDRLA